MIKMEYLEMIEKLKQMYPNRIILISCGAFYIATGEDAVTLNKELELRVSCAKKYVCKIGTPKMSICKTKITYKILCEVPLDDSILIVRTKIESNYMHFAKKYIKGDLE